MIKLSDIRRELPGLWARRWWGMVTASVIFLVGGGVTLFLPDQYESSVRIYVDTQSILKPLMSGMTVQPNLEQQISLMARTLISRPNVERTAKEAGLLHEGQTELEHEKVIEKLTRDLKFRSAGGMNIYAISYRGPSQEVAYTVVSSLLNIFMGSNVDDKRRDNDQALKFIEDQIALYEQRLSATESALKTFKLRNLNVMPNLAQDQVARSNEAHRDAQAARLELRQAEQARDALARRLATEPEYIVETATTPQGAPVPTEIDQRIEAVRGKLEDLRVRFTNEHPDVIATQRNLDQLLAEREANRNSSRSGASANTTRTPNKVHQDLRISLAQTEASIGALRARSAEADRREAQQKALASTIPEVEAEYAQLNRDYDINKKQYEQLIQRREAAQMSNSMGVSGALGEFRPVDPPRSSHRPAGPNRLLLLAGTLMASVFGGLATLFVVDRARPLVFDLRTLRAVAGRPVLGRISLGSESELRRNVRRSNVGFALVGLAYMACVGYLSFEVAMRYLGA